MVSFGKNTLWFLAALLVGTSCKTAHQEFYRDGSIRRTGNINSVTRNMVGPWVSFYPNGSKRSEGAYQGDLQTGFWRFYRESGGLEMTGSFDSEARVGIWTYYHPNGEKSAEGVYDRDDQNGRWKYWDESGNLVRSGDFQKGRPTLLWSYFEGDGMRAQGYMFDGARVGTWEFWDESNARSTREYELPANTELVREPWDDQRTVRREGFVVSGQRTGRWVSRHRNGERRMAGDYYEDKAIGDWTAYDGSGERFGTGPVTGERILPGWKYFRKAGVPDRPAGPGTGEWSEAELVEQDVPPKVVETWHREMLTAITQAEFLAPDTPTGAAPSSEQIEQIAPKPEEIVVDSDLSVKERENLDQLVNAYEGRGLKEDGGSSGGGSYSYAAAAPSNAPQGDTKLSKALIGTEFPITQFKTATGETLDLQEFRGQSNLIVVILRGFAGRICVYCAAQTRAYKKSEVLEQLAQHDGQLLVIYPGPRGALQSFLRAYRAEFDQTDPPFPLVYDPDLELTTALGITGTRAKPSTLIVDKTGIIRYAYVARQKKDRLGAEWLLEELERVDESATP